MKTTKEQIADFNAKRHKYIDYLEWLFADIENKIAKLVNE